MRVLVTGSTGLVGSALLVALHKDGHEIVRLVRKPIGNGKEILWNPSANELPTKELEGFDAVVHLAGEGIAEGRWNAAKKARIRDSRIKGTQLLVDTLCKLDKPPRTLVSASAIGYYGETGQVAVKEDAPAGNSFLAQVCRDWESATFAVKEKGIRLVNLRIGVVLSGKGGALAKMLLPFKMGVGGVLGTGRQYMSWIGLEDLVRIIQFAIENPACNGPINAVSPNAVTNREFTKTLGKVLKRPTIFPVPAFAARLAFGEMADELLLASIRVEPAKLAHLEFKFERPELESSLRFHISP